VIRCSVVIPTSDRPALVTRVMDALARQDLPPDEYEIIVCDGGERDDTRVVVEHWRAVNPVPVTYIPAGASGPTALYNAGARAARGEVLAFTDDGAIPEPGWLRHGWLALSDDAADAASGRTDPPATADVVEQGTDPAQFELPGLAANCFCRRRVFEIVGGFETSDRKTPHANGDLFAKLTERGFDVVHATDAVVIHPAQYRASARRLLRFGLFGALVNALAGMRRRKRFR
jgi:glycosyltransferase involved in cell wall biosynthesis